MRTGVLTLVTVALVGAAVANGSAPTVKISLGLRETPTLQAVPGDFVGSAGHSGEIEWFNKDEQTLVLDGTWQMFTFNISAAAIASPGLTGDGIVETDIGVLEHLRILSTGYPLEITLWIDEIRNIYDPAGPPPPINKLISTFDGAAGNGGVPYADGTEVMFQEPRFSGTTAANLATTPNISGIDNTVGRDDNSSVKVQFRFVDDQPTRWLRLTTFLAPPTKPESNPILAVAGGPTGRYTSSTVTIWLRGIPEPASLLLIGLGAALLRKR